MSPRIDDEVSGVFPASEEDVGQDEALPQCLLEELDRLIRRAIEAEFERLSENVDASERLALSLYIVDAKQFLVSLGSHVRWREVMQRIKRMQDAAGVPADLRIHEELGGVADHLSRIRHDWLTGKARHRIDERRRLAPLVAKASYASEELCSCSEPRAHAATIKERLIFGELRYQTLIKTAAAAKAA